MRRLRFATAALLPMLALLADAAHGAAACDGSRPLDVKLDTLESGKTRLAELRGGPVLLKLWATWCAPCRDQARVLRDLAAEIESRGVTVLAVDEGERDSLVRDFLVDEPSDFPVLLDRAQMIPTLCEIDRLPALVGLAPDGTVAGVLIGLAQPIEVLGLLDRIAPAN
jgi:cytochrome c biogenesis protein CcmG/thiol:disulfide interchange protein DsbE